MHVIARLSFRWWGGLLVGMMTLLLLGCSSFSFQGAAYESLKTHESMVHPPLGSPPINPSPSLNYPAYDSQRQQLLNKGDSP